MAAINLTTDSIAVRFTWWERVAGLVRDVDVPFDRVRGVELVADGLAGARGVRAPGLGLPGVRKIGTWRKPGMKTLVAVRRGQPAVQIDLEGSRHDRMLVGVDDAAQVVERLRTLPNLSHTPRRSG